MSSGFAANELKPRWGKEVPQWAKLLGSQPAHKLAISDWAHSSILTTGACRDAATATPEQ